MKKLKEVIDEQDEEVSRAVIGKGKYEIQPGFKQLEKSEAEWFSMREEARKQHLRQVALTQIWDINMDEIEALASQQEPAISAPGPSPVSTTAG